MVLDAYEKILKQFPEMILVIAPRHIDRTPSIESLLRRRGFGYQLRTDLGDPGTRRVQPVIIMNSFGELFKLYSLGTIIFCGASLSPLGGQNPIEAAAWGKVVFYGPFMEDFPDAKAILEGVNAGIEVCNPEVLAEKAIWFLDHPDVLTASGIRAREAVMNHRGAADKHARVVAKLL
jgi:3-deoxy-D-manno-octulosonic-acid transferase